MPFNCDVCGEECSYSSRVFELRWNKEAIICDKCLNLPKGCANERPYRKVLCQLETGHEGSHQAVTYWE
jgi:hypothetical protein